MVLLGDFESAADFASGISSAREQENTTFGRYQGNERMLRCGLPGGKTHTTFSGTQRDIRPYRNHPLRKDLDYSAYHISSIEKNKPVGSQKNVRM